MINKKSIFGTVLMLMATMLVQAQIKIGYEVSFIEPQAHYAEIQMNVSGNSKDYIDVKMPVWTPGSYLVREFGKNVEGFKASSNNSDLKFEKVTKNTWRVYTPNASNVKINYRIYAFEISVRTSFVDADHAFLSSTGVFMYPDGMLKSPSTVKIIPHQNWSKVSTGLEPVAGEKFTYYAEDYDVLYDSPLEVGNQDIFEFMASGVRHEVAMYGGGNYDKERLKVDMAKIVEEGTKIYGDNPNKHYTFIVHNFKRGGGGLEHLNSTVLGATRDAYNTENGYKGFLGLVAHEYNHLWNVKRLRPVALGPFDYDNEVYTTNLWISEGFTSYYENKYLLRGGFTTVDQFLNDLSGSLTSVINTPGSKVQSAAAASFDAWIIGYRPNENSRNSSISYYAKGELIGLMMDLEIANATKGDKSLDDVLKAMYEEGKKLNRGYTDAEFKAMVEKISGINFDNFYAKYVNGVDNMEYEKYLNFAGVNVKTENSTPGKAVAGANLMMGRGLVVTGVTRNLGAWNAGLNVNDIILAIDDKNIEDILSTIRLKSPSLTLETLPVVNEKNIGDVVKVKVERDGKEKTFSIVLNENPNIRISSSVDPKATKLQKAVFKRWTGV